MHPRYRVVLPVAIFVLLVTAGSLGASPGKAPWRIALSSDREGDSEIYSMNADGTGVRRLAQEPEVRGARAVVARRDEAARSTARTRGTCSSSTRTGAASGT